MMPQFAIHTRAAAGKEWLTPCLPRHNPEEMCNDK